MNDLISVIVSTYNREDALDAVLRALSRQTDRHFEIIIADDGSGPATGRVIGKWAGTAALPVRHVWHEDRGFRLADIRNRGIQASAGIASRPISLMIVSRAVTWPPARRWACRAACGA